MMFRAFLLLSLCFFPLDAFAKSFFDDDLPRFDLAGRGVEVVRIAKPVVSEIPVNAAPPVQRGVNDAPVDFEADNLRYDESGEIVIASGDVIIVQEGRILRADQVRYDIGQDRVSARGNVVLNEPSGDIHFSQSFELQDQMKNGVVQALQTTLNDGSRFQAESGERTNGTRIVMRNAHYTACSPCVENPDAAPPWAIRASEVHHDEENAEISYENARFEVYGVPVAYTPYFAHPDGSVEQKSGFLAPSFGFKSDFGWFVENNYYWAIAPDQDMTIGMIAMTEQAPLGLVQYRKRWSDAFLEIESGITYSDRTDDVGGLDVKLDEEIRGHIFANALWEMNDKWRSGFNVEYVSDDQYARQYDISSEDNSDSDGDLTSQDVFETRLFAERFSGRDYALAQMQTFKDTRVSDLEADQPELLPVVLTSFVGDPGSMPLIGGRWDLAGSFSNLFRDGSGQDVLRFSTDAGWERRFISDLGLVANAEVSLRGDFYRVSDRDVSLFGSGASGDTSQGRFYPQAHFETSYPIAKPLDTMQVRIEPIVAFTAAPNIDTDEDIPNEDSVDVQVDASNLFAPNRFSGYDAVEDGSRVTYGMRAGMHGYAGSYVEGFLGQSYRLDSGDINFANGSGLEDQNSDIVGSIDSQFGEEDRGLYNMSYRFQLDNDTLASARHEFDVSADWNRFRLSSNYLYAEGLEGTEVEEDREQVRAAARLYLSKEWEITSSAQYDLGVSPGLRKATAGINYYGDCVSWSLTGVRNLTDDSSGESDSEVLFSIGLKNIGEFLTSDLRE